MGVKDSGKSGKGLRKMKSFFRGSDLVDDRKQ